MSNSAAFTADFNALFALAFLASGQATAAGSGDDTKVTGNTIDLSGFRSGTIAIPYSATLQQDETLSMAVEIQESDDGTSWDTAEELQASAVEATGDTGGSTETGIVRIADNFEGRKRYVRVNVTPDLSASGTDTAFWTAVLVQGGAEELPAA